MCISSEWCGFHESYYAHSCPIVPEKDVLHTDIVGTSCICFLKRWWYDLFLLSPSNDNSRGFYNSSHAMRIERFRQYRKYRSRIHPLSKFSYFWNCLILLAFVINKILFRITSTIIFHRIPLAYYFIALLLEFLIIFDLFVNLKTGYIDQQIKKVILDTRKSLVNYCSKKLFLHMISATPMHCLMFLRFGMDVNNGLCKSNMFICALKIISVFSIYRVFEMSATLSWNHSSKNKHTYNFFRIGMVGIVTMIQLYDVVDALWILKVIYDETVDSTSFIGKLLLIRYGTFKNVPNYLVLCFDISRIFKSLLLFSFGIKNSSHPFDKLSTIIAYVISNGFYAWSLLECFSLVGSVLYPKDQLRNSRYCVLKLLKARQLSDDLLHKVDQYFHFKSSRLKLLESENGLYKSLLSGLKKEATLSCYSKLMMRIPLFSDWPLPLIEQLALMLKQEMYMTSDIVADAWTQGNGLKIVDIGILAVYSIYHEETGHLIDGDYFGELSLVTDKEARMSYVVAVTPCRILLLDKLLFRQFMRQYPQIFYELKVKLRQKYESVVADSVRASELSSSPPNNTTLESYQTPRHHTQ